ncbi:WXG100 family type VII secretion target [Microbacterium sp. Clip185]|uniref:WXG100 family type VII secretion target n=1 Tax=Microbacterium sp. Clip185 TaxID=3025663 RepID=UPI003FD5FB8C
MSISFDPARHADMVDVLARAAGSLEDVLAALDGEVSALRGAWSGAARDAYDEAQREWTVSLDALNRALRSSVGAARRGAVGWCELVPGRPRRRGAVGVS